MFYIASSTLKIKCGESKGMQEKVSIMGVWYTHERYLYFLSSREKNSCNVFCIFAHFGKNFFPRRIQSRKSFYHILSTILCAINYSLNFGNCISDGNYDGRRWYDIMVFWYL